jgi:pyridoxal 5'-phosphate synthase pdxT subunit
LPAAESTPRIGVLAIQGDFERHAAALAEAGAIASLVRDAQGLENLDGLVMPGGESTTMLKFLIRAGFLEAVQTFIQQKPVFGTCAGAILLAKEVRHPSQLSLGALDIAVERNAYGDQRDSAILELETSLPGGPLEAVFIRAPRIAFTGPAVEVLAQRDGFPVLVRQGHILAATFHPELSADRRVHAYFLQQVHASNSQRGGIQNDFGTDIDRIREHVPQQ